MLKKLSISAGDKGLHDITPQVLEQLDHSAIGEGLCTLYIQHTSASLLIQENYDRTARADLESWFDRLVPDNDPLYTHTLEGPDDMPAHIKSALTATSLVIPISGSRLLLGAWQGIFLWEHRCGPHQRQVLMHLLNSC